MSRRKKEGSQEGKIVDDAARAANLKATSFRVDGQKLFFIRDQEDNLLNGGRSMDVDEALQFISRQGRTSCP